MIDMIKIILSIIILTFGQPILWFVVTVLLIFYLMVELTEILAMPRKYFREPSNYLDIGIILLTFITLYLPKKYIWNPQRFGFLDDVKDETLERGCAVKRCISALLIVLVVCRYLGSLSQSPGFKQYNLYLIMFNKVMKC